MSGRLEKQVVNCLGVLWPSLRGGGGLKVCASVLSLSSHLSSLCEGSGTLAIRFHGCAQSRAGGSTIFLTLPRPGSLASHFPEKGRVTPRIRDTAQDALQDSPLWA